MNAFERFFYSEYGASRAYLFAKGFLLLLALDTWMLMIGHAGRYGIGGFNVAHFGWLDALLPTPSAGFYVAVLVLAGLLALVIVLTGIRRTSVLALFVLYTFSWSMSMLDSYQHHYFVSLVLLCLAFFPQTSATEIHALPPPAPESERRQRKKQHELQRAARAETYGWLYAASVLAIAAAYAAIDADDHTWVAFFLFAGAVALATFMYAPERRAGGPLLARGWGYPLLGATVAIVYTYTAIAKIDPNWLDGHTLRRISSVEQVFGGLAEYAEQLGMERERFWSLFSSAVIPQEMLLGASYLLAVHQDRLELRWLRVACTLGFALAVVLHVGAEAMGLEIGWFSYYMLLLACCFLLPLAVVDRLATVFTWPERWLLRTAREWEQQSPPTGLVSVLLALGCAGLLALVGRLLDLPGATEACAAAGAVLLAVTLLARVRPRARDPRPYALATIAAAAGMWAAIAASPVRWDFYRYLGGDLSRRGELEAALQIYERGERYAPPGQTRRDKIEQLKRKLVSGVGR
jgi:hypothetical protein